MKKLLTLMVVLCLASLANAAMVISVNGDTTLDEITIAPSDIITLDVYDTVGANELLYLDVYDGSGDGVSWFTLSNGQLGPGAGDGASGTVGPYEATGYMEVEITNAWLPASTKLPGVIYLIDLHCDAEGDVYVEIWDQGGGNLADSLTIHQVIPEPMTIALLGIGGLFLRRRK